MPPLHTKRRLLLLFVFFAIVCSTMEKSSEKKAETNSFTSTWNSSYAETEFVSIDRPFHKKNNYVLNTKRIPFQTSYSPIHGPFIERYQISDVVRIDKTTSLSNIANIIRVKREDLDACMKFEEGDSIKQEFYSPGYPEPYPKNISCFRVLEADPGMVLKVEFRDNFELEDQEKCSYDYLEVRDGKYGYSRLIGKFCRAFPFPEITSSSRYLWLHFHSDSSIQGNGFRAVWNMIPRPLVKDVKENGSQIHPNDDKLSITMEACKPNECSISEVEICTPLQSILNKTGERLCNSVALDWSKDALKNLELHVTLGFDSSSGYNNSHQRFENKSNENLQAQYSLIFQIQMTFPKFHLDKPNECDINYVQVYDREPSMIHNPSLINNFCGSIADLVTSKGNEVYLRFFATKAAINSSFEAIMTTIREKEGSKDKVCNADEFDCQDACIADELRCNNRPNCRYRFDEDADICSTKASGLNMSSEHVIIILVVFTILMSGLCFTCIFNCIKKLIHDHRIIREHLRQSRERKLDELGRKMTPCSILDGCTELGGDVHRHGSETPSLEILAHPKELVSPMASIDRDYVRERSVGLSVDLSDIHQSNNVSNATQERLQESSEERETREMGCQTRESIFDSGLILKPSAHPAFTTFGIQTTTPLTASRKPSLDYHPTHHYHHHAHPHYHPHHQASYHQHHHHSNDTEIGTPPEKLEPISPHVSQRCSVCHPSAVPRTLDLCPRHSLTPIVPAPPGWSAHESVYTAEDLSSLQRLQIQQPQSSSSGGSPVKLTTEPEREHSNSLSSSRPSPRFSIQRQKTVGSGEHYGFIYGHEERDKERHCLVEREKEAGDYTGSSGNSSQRSMGAKPVRCPQVLDSRFKTEAVIEVDQKRPFSIESTKSAPDVIATH
ncbi:uncharacterized protein LOC106641909 [Copidosoma floridanum]|uniref:uncharacterized protein LOC106641909 n=1 Tax=Copidosoma floridanum TaxID=29053 RepID=UPI000C6F93D4|nr:uncharacterized protein LOC106641909 [Copidosoma floridanum]